MFYDYIMGGGSSALIEMATGLGKSLVNAKICQEIIEKHPSSRILCVVHSQELVSQNYQELIKLWPWADAGVNSAGLNRRDWGRKITFAGVQSIHKHAALLGPVDLCIIDECHLLSRKSGGMYQKVLEELRSVTPKMRLLGLTATPYRLDSGRLDEGEDALFEKTIYSYGIVDGIRDGYLSPLISRAMVSEIDTAGVKMQNGDFAAGQLEAAAMRDGRVDAAVDEIIAYGHDRKSWLIFCSGIAHADAVRDALFSRGIEAATITGKTPREIRKKQLRDFKAGRFRALVNVNVLTTGFNVPGLDLIALLRPTKSPGLAIQQIGRGTRLAEGKENCLILDFAQILKTHGPVDQIAPPDRQNQKGKSKPGMPVRICPECNFACEIAAKSCPECGHEFLVQKREYSHDKNADKESVVLSTQAKSKYLKVKSWNISIHKKENKPDSLKITYRIGLFQSISEFLCFDHSRYAYHKAAKRWGELNDGDQNGWHPQSVIDAHDMALTVLKMPAEILVRQNGRYFEVIGSEGGGHGGTA